MSLYAPYAPRVGMQRLFAVSRWRVYIGARSGLVYMAVSRKIYATGDRWLDVPRLGQIALFCLDELFDRGVRLECGLSGGLGSMESHMRVDESIYRVIAM